MTCEEVKHRNDYPKLFNTLGFQGIGVELGVGSGEYSSILRKNWNKGILVLIDPWVEQSKSEYVDIANVPQSEQTKRYAEVLNRFSGQSDVKIVKKFSHQAVLDFENESLDFIYIDANHAYEMVKYDIHVWYPKIRPAGLMLGHDYWDGWHGETLFGVKKAVDELVAKKNLKLYLTQDNPQSWMVLGD